MYVVKVVETDASVSELVLAASIRGGVTTWASRLEPYPCRGDLGRPKAPSRIRACSNFSFADADAGAGAGAGAFACAAFMGTATDDADRVALSWDARGGFVERNADVATFDAILDRGGVGKLRFLAAASAMAM